MVKEGTGGQGGAGQEGAPGVSAKLIVQGTSPTVVVAGANQPVNSGVNNPSDFNLGAQSIITVDNINCALRDVTYTGLSGSTNLGTGASNPSGPVTQYTTLGRKTITSNGSDYVEFHNIAIEQSSYIPDISTSANPIDATPNPDDYWLCVGDGANFTANIPAPPVSYEWEIRDSGGGVVFTDGGATVSQISYTFNTPDTYTIDVYINTDCCGDSPIDQITVFVEPQPTISITGDGICEGGSTSLSAVVADASTVTWSPPNNLNITTGTSVTVDGLFQTTTYTVTAESTNGYCTASEDVTVTVYPIPTLNVSSTDADCTDNGTATVTPSGGSGDYTYTWSPNVGTGSTVTGLEAGAYDVTVTDNISGCSDFTSVSVGPSATAFTAVPTATQQVSCNGFNNGQVTIGVFQNGSQVNPPTGYTFTWTPRARRRTRYRYRHRTIRRLIFRIGC